MTPIRAEWSSLGSLGTGHPFGRRSEGTGLPRNRSAENVRSRVGPYPRTTLITSNPTEVSGRFSCNTRTLKAYVVITTTRIGIKRDASKRSSSQNPVPDRQVNHCSVFSTSCSTRSSAPTRSADINSTASCDGLFTRMKLSVPSAGHAKTSNSIRQPGNSVRT